jgi:hypothetical protein
MAIRISKPPLSILDLTEPCTLIVGFSSDIVDHKPTTASIWEILVGAVSERADNLN